MNVHHVVVLSLLLTLPCSTSLILSLLPTLPCSLFSILSFSLFSPVYHCTTHNVLYIATGQLHIINSDVMPENYALHTHMYIIHLHVHECDMYMYLYFHVYVCYGVTYCDGVITIT